jgi:hypothetical protein
MGKIALFQMMNATEAFFLEPKFSEENIFYYFCSFLQDYLFVSTHVSLDVLEIFKAVLTTSKSLSLSLAYFSSIVRTAGLAVEISPSIRPYT